jgi:hypothetical protein
VIAIAHGGIHEGLFFAEPPAAFFVVEAVAHGLAVGSHHREIHFGDDVRQNSFDGDGVGDHGFDALGPGLVQKRDSRSTTISIWSRFGHVHRGLKSKDEKSWNAVDDINGGDPAPQTSTYGKVDLSLLAWEVFVHASLILAVFYMAPQEGTS